MGTDALGRDLAVGLLFGFPVALAIGLATSVLATAIGTFLGIVSGYLAGKTDIAIQRFSAPFKRLTKSFRRRSK